MTQTLKELRITVNHAARSSIPMYHERAIEFWRTVHVGWPKYPYSLPLVRGLVELFSRLESDSGIPIKNILDIGCGAGNPSIGLALEGLQVTAADSDAQAVGLLEEAARQLSAPVRTHVFPWSELAEKRQKEDINLADLVLCRGNTLIYASSWDQDGIDPWVAREGILQGLRNMLEAIIPRGFLYVDLTSEREFADGPEHLESLGLRRVEGRLVHIYWITKHDQTSNTRHVSGYRVVHDRVGRDIEAVYTHSFHSYLLRPNELRDMAMDVGFLPFQERVSVAGEEVYDVFLFQKPGE